MIKQVFKGKLLTRTKVKNNILKIWDKTLPDERFDWYKDAKEFAINEVAQIISLEHSNQPKYSTYNINKACGIIAALSPLKTWEQNKKIAIEFVLTENCGHIQQFKNKALDILKSSGTDEEILSILKGKKISSFYCNIRYPQQCTNITIDRHALSIALNTWITDEDYRGITQNQYDFFVDCYKLASQKVNVSPLLMQSATWVRWRKIKTNY